MRIKKAIYTKKEDLKNHLEQDWKFYQKLDQLRIALWDHHRYLQDLLQEAREAERQSKEDILLEIIDEFDKNFSSLI